MAIAQAQDESLVFECQLKLARLVCPRPDTLGISSISPKNRGRERARFVRLGGLRGVMPGART